MPSSYDRFPAIVFDPQQGDCQSGLAEVTATLCEEIRVRRAARASLAAAGAAFPVSETPGGDTPFRVVVECYPGVALEPLVQALQQSLPGSHFFHAEAVYRDPQALREQFALSLGHDPVFGYMQRWHISSYFQNDRLEELAEKIFACPGIAIVFGTGASLLVTDADLLVYLSSTRWVLQGRQRAHEVGNLGLNNADERPSTLYKNAFFLDWRVGDALRHELYPSVDFLIDVDTPDLPRMVSGQTLRSAVHQTVQRPFRVVPFFDPGPWGGQWMRRQFGLPEGPSNYAWAFDCVPEENSILWNFGGKTISLPAQVLVEEAPQDLLGESVLRAFGAEFPIRFDYLDTVEGGNLSLQVHPLRAYIREHFGMHYTQDESYYILDCEPESQLFLGLREGVRPQAFEQALRQANAGSGILDAGRWVNQLPTHKHEHFSIPAGTVHCSGSGNVVLEISATPYIFTFKLWDWNRLGLDGRPRPVHLEHGLANIQWNRDTQWVRDNLLRPVTTISEGDGWREERTGLHELQFLETRRHWFTRPVLHNTEGTVHVLCLVEGDAIVVESPNLSFPPLLMHYGETFIVPAAVGRYQVRPASPTNKPLATVKAYVRTSGLPPEGNDR